MPARKKLPRNAKRLPKGTTRADYEPEVIQEWERDRWRQRQEAYRKRLRHRGIRAVTFNLGQEARETLARISKERGITRSAVITHLLEKQR